MAKKTSKVAEGPEPFLTFAVTKLSDREYRFVLNGDDEVVPREAVGIYVRVVLQRVIRLVQAGLFR